jgi:hypothetical protein
MNDDRSKLVSNKARFEIKDLWMHPTQWGAMSVKPLRFVKIATAAVTAGHFDIRRKEMKMKNGVLALAAAAALAGSLAAQASIVTYDFTVNGGGVGPLGNENSSGTFSYDTSIIPAGGGLVTGTGLLTGLSFTWGGLSYGLTFSSTGALGFDSSGALDGVNIGTNCANDAFGGCSVTSTETDWVITGGGTVPFTSASFLYTVGDGQFYSGSAGLTQVEAPAPAPVWLMAGCLIGLAAAMRKPRSPKPVEVFFRRR